MGTNTVTFVVLLDLVALEITRLVGITVGLTLTNMTSLELLRNSQRDFSSSVTLKYIMLQSRGLRADTRSVNEVMLRRIAVIKSSVVFNL